MTWSYSAGRQADSEGAGASGTRLDLVGTAERMGSAAAPAHGLFSVAVSGESLFLHGASALPEKVFWGTDGGSCKTSYSYNLGSKVPEYHVY